MNRPEITEARKVARATAALARHAAALDRQDEMRLQRVRHHNVTHQRKALLIVNSKSGRKHDSILHIRELADLLENRGIDVDVHVKLGKTQAEREARAAADRGCQLVVAAGGDGTVEAVARGLVGSGTALGIVPLGTYNNVATSLGIPAELDAAVALIAAGTARPVDVGEVEAHGGSGPRFFLEIVTLGLGAALMPVGQDLEKHRWRAAVRELPDLLTQAPARVRIRLDDAPWRQFETLLLTVSNAPRSGAGLMLAPHARMDDGLLDLAVYEGLGEAGLALRWRALSNGDAERDPHRYSARALSIRVQSDGPVPVAADTRLVGTTPAHVRVRPGQLLVLSGDAPALAHPPTPALANISNSPNHSGWWASMKKAIA